MARLKRWEDRADSGRAQMDLRDRQDAGAPQGCAMTGRNPWVVLGVTEDTPYQEVQRAFRRRVKRTHPDGGGDAAEFAAIVQAFDVVRRARPSECRRSPALPTLYDTWLHPLPSTRSWTEDAVRGSGRPWRCDVGWAVPTMDLDGGDFATVLLGELSKASGTVPGR